MASFLETLVVVHNVGVVQLDGGRGERGREERGREMERRWREKERGKIFYKGTVLQESAGVIGTCSFTMLTSFIILPMLEALSWPVFPSRGMDDLI